MSPVLVVLVVGAALLWWWQAAVGCRELANRAAFAACDAGGLVLLDGTVAFRGFSRARDGGGRWRLKRTYTFDYTADGATRAQGFVALLGRELEAVGLEATALQRGP